jgi:hypothetical protein
MQGLSSCGEVAEALLAVGWKLQRPCLQLAGRGDGGKGGRGRALQALFYTCVQILDKKLF